MPMPMPMPLPLPLPLEVHPEKEKGKNREVVMEDKVPASAWRTPPPPRRCSDGSFSDMVSKEEGNSNTSMVRLYLNSRIYPYYFRRCKKVRPSNIESLPDELLFQILVCLPADQLYDRARFVYRRWYHIIHSNAFVNTQLHHSLCGLLLSWRTEWNRHPLFVTATQGRIEISEFSYKCRTTLLASCNGLTLELGSFDEKLFPHIINPATKQPFLLPSLSCRKMLPQHSGIAYAVASMEYKVTLPHRPRVQQLVLGIVTVGVDNSWRQVKVEHLSKNSRAIISRAPVITEGFMHWVGLAYVLTMDVETEVLIEHDEVPLPQGKIRNYYLSTGRCLSLLITHIDKDFLWELWEMKSETGEWTTVFKLGTKKSFLQQFCYGQDQFGEPVGWVKYPEVLALRVPGKTSCTCILYNLDTHEISSIEFPGFLVSFTSIAHKNSLTWLS